MSELESKESTEKEKKSKEDNDLKNLHQIVCLVDYQLLYLN